MYPILLMVELGGLAVRGLSLSVDVRSMHLCLLDVVGELLLCHSSKIV